MCKLLMHVLIIMLKKLNKLYDVYDVMITHRKLNT